MLSSLIALRTVGDKSWKDKEYVVGKLFTDGDEYELENSMPDRMECMQGRILDIL